MFKLLRKFRERRFFARSDRQQVFSWIYQTNRWGSAESRSGKGSEQIQTQAVQTWLPELIAELGIERMLDLPCGDMNWLDPERLGIGYTGADVVEALIQQNRRKWPAAEFLVLDACVDPLPTVDLVFMRDLLVHLSFADARSALVNLKVSGSTWLACTTYPHVDHNHDKVTGRHHRLNLQKPPFSWPAPVYLLDEREKHGKHMGVWRIADLPISMA